MRNFNFKKGFGILGSAVLSLSLMSGCSSANDSGVTEIEVVSYKPEAAKTFEKIAEKFNETHDDIHLTINSPNEAMTILKTRFVREDYPDIIGIGGDINYSGFLDAGLFENIEDVEALDTIKDGYKEIDKNLEFIPQEGVYALPFASNAAGILYNKEMFEEHGWEVPTTWSEFQELCKQIEAEGIQPLYAGYKDTWTTLAPWNAIAVTLADPDVAAKVNRGETTFAEAYKETAEKTKDLLQYIEKNPYAYSYADASTAFANGESAMWAIGSYAIPQIKSVNPDMEIDSFVFPASDNAEDNVLNSGVDIQFSIMKDSDNKEAAKEVLEYLNSDEVISMYLEEQGGVACKEGDFVIADELESMKPYIESGKVRDYQDHYYPSEMAVDAMIQTYLMDDSDDATENFLQKFDTEWVRYNRDLIQKIKDHEAAKGTEDSSKETEEGKGE